MPTGQPGGPSVQAMDKTCVSLPLAACHPSLKYETLWATDGPGSRKTLLNSSFFVPLAVGDVVDTIARDGREIIADLVQAGDMTLSTCVVHASVSDEEQIRVTESWRARGARWTEGGRGFLLTVWAPDVSADDVARIVRDDVAHRTGWEAPFVYAPEDRHAQMEMLLRHGPG